MKKLTAMILAAAMAFVMAGCGGQAGTAETPAAGTEAQTETEAPETKAPETKTPETEAVTEAAAETAAEEPAQETVQIPQEPCIQLHPVATDYYECAQREDNTMIYVAHATYLSLNGEEAAAWPELQSALTEDYCEYVHASVSEFIQKWQENTGDQNLDLGGTDPFRQTVQISRMDSNMASLLTSTYEFLGGQHGYTALRSFNYKTDERRWVQLSEIVKDNEKLQQILEERLVSEYPDAMFFDLPNDLKNYVLDQPAAGDSIPYTWTMDYDSVQIYFGENDLGPYASGSQRIDLKFADYPELFNCSFGAAPENCITCVEPYANCSAGDTVYTFAPRYNTSGYINELVFDVNGTVNAFPVFCYAADVWFVSAGEDRFFYAFTKEEDDVEKLWVYRVENGSVKEETSAEARIAAVYGSTDPVGTAFGYDSYASARTYEIPADPAGLKLEVKENGTFVQKTLCIEDGAVVIR